jgi:hypothetical protein
MLCTAPEEGPKGQEGSKEGKEDEGDEEAGGTDEGKGVHEAEEPADGAGRTRRGRAKATGSTTREGHARGAQRAGTDEAGAEKRTAELLLVDSMVHECLVAFSRGEVKEKRGKNDEGNGSPPHAARSGAFVVLIISWSGLFPLLRARGPESGASALSS